MTSEARASGGRRRAAAPRAGGGDGAEPRGRLRLMGGAAGTGGEGTVRVVPVGVLRGEKNRLVVRESRAVMPLKEQVGSVWLCGRRYAMFNV